MRTLLLATIGAVALAVGLGGASRAAPIDVFENGHNVQIRYLYPNTGGVVADTGTILVGGGPEMTPTNLISSGAASPSGMGMGGINISVNLSTNQVVIGLAGRAGSFNAAAFNGIEIIHFEPGIDIDGVTIDTGLSTNALETAVVSFDANTIAVDFAGISFAAGNKQLVLNISAQSTPIPEPASLALWSLLGLGAAGYYRRRQRRRAS